MNFHYHQVSRGKEAPTFIVLAPRDGDGRPFGFGTVQRQPNKKWRGCTMRDDCKDGFRFKQQAAKWAWEKYQSYKETPNGNSD